MHATPECKFYRFFPHGRPPSRADRFASGTLSMRAAQYCDAVTVASGLGWCLFPPLDVLLIWDGQNICWSQDGDVWHLVNDYAHFPNFPEEFDKQAPSHLQGTMPALLTALPEPGLIQVSFGLFARTAPGWSMSIAKPPNLPASSPIEHFEGIVNTSQWFGPLFINLRLTKTDVPIRLDADRPLAQARPIPHTLLSLDMLAFEIVDEIGRDEWEAYRISVVEPSTRAERPFGAYAVQQRRNRCPSLEGTHTDLGPRESVQTV